MARDLNRLNTAQWERPPHFLQERAPPRPRATATANTEGGGGGVTSGATIRHSQPTRDNERATTGLGYGNPPPRLTPHDHTHADADREGIAV